MKKITLIRLVRDNDLNVIGYVFKNDHNDEIEVEASKIKNVILNTTVVTQGLNIDADGEVVLSKKFIDHGMTISGDEPYKSKIENRNTRYALQLSLDDMGYNINNVLHLRELNTCKIKSFDSVSEMLKAFKHISKFKRSFEKVLIEEAYEIKNLDMLNNIEQYKDRLLTFYGNCYTYFFLTTETRVRTEGGSICS